MDRTNLSWWTAPARAIASLAVIGWIGGATVTGLGKPIIDGLALCAPVIGFAGVVAGFAISGQTLDTYSRSRSAVFASIVLLWFGMGAGLYSAAHWLSFAFAGLGVILGLYHIGKRAPRGHPLDPASPINGPAGSRAAAGQ